MSDIIEAITPTQIEQVRDLFREYRAQLPLYLCHGEFERGLAKLPGEFGPPGGKLLLATIAGQPIGCVGFRRFPVSGTSEMKHLYVRPVFRSRDLGEKLVTRVLNEAAALGYRSIRLDTHPDTMGAAVRLYQRFGFHEVASDPLPAVEGLVYMELELKPEC